MSDVAKWLRDLLAHVTKETDVMRLIDDLADLCAEQHEALLDFGDSKNCGDQNCKPCRAMKAAEALKERYE